MWFGKCGLSVVVRSKGIDLVELISLTETIPCPEICLIDIDGRSIALDRRVCVLHFKVFVAHQRPRREVLLVKANGPLEVYHSLVVIASKRVIVSDSAARLWPILVIIEDVVGQVG